MKLHRGQRDILISHLAAGQINIMLIFKYPDWRRRPLLSGLNFIAHLLTVYHNAVLLVFFSIRTIYDLFGRKSTKSGFVIFFMIIDNLADRW